MSNMNTTKITGRLFDFFGEPYTGALSICLERSAVDTESGFVLAAEPRDIQPGVDGRFELDLWPNARADSPTRYVVTGPRLSLHLVVPDQPEVDFQDTITD